MTTHTSKRRFTVSEYHCMGRAGVFDPGERVELIEGDVFGMTPIGSRHAACVNRLTQLLTERIGPDAIVSVQNPLQLDRHSEPQPDLAVLKPRADFYAEAHPGPQDVLLVIEVADTSLEHDQARKLPLYARAGVPEVWLVDLAAQRVLVHRNPDPSGYAQVDALSGAATLAAQTLPQLQLNVAELFA